VLKGVRARFYSVLDPVNQFDAEKRAGRAGRLAGRLLNQNAIVLVARKRDQRTSSCPLAHGNSVA
jgi:hypothetical protein